MAITEPTQAVPTLLGPNRKVVATATVTRPILCWMLAAAAIFGGFFWDRTLGAAQATTGVSSLKTCEDLSLKNGEKCVPIVSAKVIEGDKDAEGKGN